MKSRPLLLLSGALILSPFLPCPGWSAENSPTALATSEAQNAETVFQLARASLTGRDATGRETPVDPQKAFDLMQMAAAQGHAGALGGLGYFHANGVAVEKNEAKAVEWFRKGAEKGNPTAQFNLGRMLAEGKGIAPDQVAGREWMKKAADQGVNEAVFAVGNIYYFGEFGEPQDRKRAFPLLLQAAEQGNLAAQNMVGFMLCEGPDVPRDKAAGMNWYRKAAVRGHTKAQSNLGRMLTPSDRRPEKDPAERVEALTWLLVASGKGDVMATRLLGDTLPAADQKELAEARRKAAEIATHPEAAALLGKKAVPAAGIDQSQTAPASAGSSSR